MSYSFDGANDRMKGTLTGTFSGARTMACFFKVTAHPVASDCMYMVGVTDGTDVDSLRLGTTATDDQWQGQVLTSGSTTGNSTVSALNVDGVWTGAVYVYTSNVLRDLYIGSITNTGTSTTDRAAGAVQFVQLGENLANGADYTGKLAEVAFWNAALTSQQITDFLAGVSAATIQAANLQGYWSLASDNTTQANEGLDVGGDLTVTAAVFDADHPTITGASAAKRRRIGLMGIG